MYALKYHIVYVGRSDDSFDMGMILKLGLYGLGTTALVFGVSMAVFGSNAVFTFFNSALSLFYNDGPIADLASPNVDSELRFCGVMFAFYGCILLQTAQNIGRYFTRIPFLLAAFALAGFARVIGFNILGKPHTLFTVLMILELTLPAVLIICWYQQKKHFPQQLI